MFLSWPSFTYFQFILETYTFGISAAKTAALSEGIITRPLHEPDLEPLDSEMQLFLLELILFLYVPFPFSSALIDGTAHIWMSFHVYNLNLYS